MRRGGDHMKKDAMDRTELLVLSLLSGEDMYGYQIITELSKRSEDVFQMKEGTLYPVLHGLWKDGQVECYEREAAAGRARKYYHLTGKGRRALREERAAWERYQRGMEAVLGACPVPAEG